MPAATIVLRGGQAPHFQSTTPQGIEGGSGGGGAGSTGDGREGEREGGAGEGSGGAGMGGGDGGGGDDTTPPPDGGGDDCAAVYVPVSTCGDTAFPTLPLITNVIVSASDTVTPLLV